MKEYLNNLSQDLLSYVKTSLKRPLAKLKSVTTSDLRPDSSRVVRSC